jgi:hypothetical protein
VTDEGATIVNDVSIEGSSTLTAIKNTVDVNTPGLYYMLYSTPTKNGFSASAARYIAVTDYPDNVDLSGVYVRASNGVPVNLERMSRGLYRTDDMGGAGLPDAGYFAVINDSTIDFGLQYSETLGTEIFAVNAGLLISPDETSYTYALRAPGYGEQQRVFIKE